MDKATYRKRAVISDDGLYRYQLWREWDEATAADPFVLLIGLNPSTADGETDDATARRVVRFAESWGYKRVCIVNLFAFRATQPKDMMAAADPVGPDNDAHLTALALSAKLIVCAWGNGGRHRDRGSAVGFMLWQRGWPLHDLGLTKWDQPKHPLRLSHKTVPQLRGA